MRGCIGSWWEGSVPEKNNPRDERGSFFVMGIITIGPEKRCYIPGIPVSSGLPGLLYQAIEQLGDFLPADCGKINRLGVKEVLNQPVTMRIPDQDV